MLVTYHDTLGAKSPPTGQMLVSQIHFHLVHLLPTVTDLPIGMNVGVLHYNVALGVLVPIEELVITPTTFLCLIFLYLHQISMLGGVRLVYQLHLRHAIFV